MELYDKTGRKMEDGDLFRIPHFVDRRRRQRWLYFFLHHTPQFDTEWWGVDIRGGFQKHHWPIYEKDCGLLEVMESPAVKQSDGSYGDFVERPINRAILKSREEEPHERG